MTVGEKIRRIRSLRGMTQKELGIRAGFSSGTADARIRQYEIGKMKPKADKLQRIADALDVNISALSDINITSLEDVMQIFFELEQTLDLQIHKDENGYFLRFNPDGKYMTNINWALDAWYHARNLYFPYPESIQNPENDTAYQLWTCRYPDDMKSLEQKASSLVTEKYRQAVSLLEKEPCPVEKIKDIIVLYEQLLRSGIKMDISRAKPLSHRHKGTVCTSFSHSELLSLTGISADYFTEFLRMMRFLDSSTDITVSQGTHSFDGETYEDYYITNSPICSALLLVVKEIQPQILDNTFLKSENQSKYKHTLQLWNIPISK